MCQGRGWLVVGLAFVMLAGSELLIDERMASELAPAAFVAPLATAFVPAALVPTLVKLVAVVVLVPLSACASISGGNEGSAGTVKPRLNEAWMTKNAS